ncbi:hypothetical protein AQJ91_14380 [Streptomyces dysideae]|uniref:Secreted protein n=1 Tax=Streptomyces dysideae TaxID=909626 RepID=A0A117S0T9_9ACTN|nr:hypothetical protein AQJ91_14380 [Streptomyces dysideae]
MRSTVPVPSAFLVAYLATYPATLASVYSATRASVSSPSPRAVMGSTLYRPPQAMTRSPMASEAMVSRALFTARLTAALSASEVAQAGGGVVCEASP